MAKYVLGKYSQTMSPHHSDKMSERTLRWLLMGVTKNSCLREVENWLWILSNGWRFTVFWNNQLIFLSWVDENINNWDKYQMLIWISKAIDKHVNNWTCDNLTTIKTLTKMWTTCCVAWQFFTLKLLMLPTQQTNHSCYYSKVKSVPSLR